MKKLFFVLFSLLTITNATAQILDPVKWKTKTEKISDTEFNLIFEGTIDKGWHMYTQFTPEGGPLPTELIFENAKGNFELVGKAKESVYKKQFNEVFEVDEYFFENNVTLTQKVKILNTNFSELKMSLEYQVCKEVCINQQKNFTVSIPKGMEVGVNVNETNDVTQVTSDKEKTQANLSEDQLLQQKSKKGLLSIFFLAFLGGFAALFTPCVFPMIPMTVSFFTKQSKTRAKGIRNALFYGFSIIAIYVLLGSLVTAVFGAEALNELSTNVWFNLIFFVLLVVFAVSFLGAFEIMLPNSWANKVDRQADRGGIVGILFMALALAIISFSCTGPIVGTLLVEAASKGGLAPIIGMLGFSLALALPFMLFAMFPGWLNSLPKSGGWLNSVKVSLGFLELALALKFLSNADLVLQLHLLEREIFLAIWIAIFGIWALYLFGSITLPHDSPSNHISVGRLSLGIIVITFTIYLIPGLWGAPLKLISAFPPPLTYSESPYGFGSNTTVSNSEELPDGAEFGPHGLIVFNDYETGLAYAKKVNKPVMIDFTGYACVNCRKMENNVWSEESVLKILKNDLVIISLYVDDKRALPESEQTVSPTTGKKIVTIGNKWSDFIITRYKTNTQPFYVLMNLEEQNLNEPVSYTPDYKDYEIWLKEGIATFK
jgi:thiol:disulfide interchange protein